MKIMKGKKAKDAYMSQESILPDPKQRSESMLTGHKRREEILK